MPDIVFALAAVSFVGAWVLTGRVRRYALARQMLDVPNERSSHSVITPRGGGIAIVITTMASLIVCAISRLLPWAYVAGMLAGGSIAAAVGFVDDHAHMRRRWRLLGHVVAATCVLAGVGGMPPIADSGVAIDLGPTGAVLGALYAVWLLNLTNFMDGIDGIAAVEVITVCLGGIVLYAAGDPGTDWVAPLLLAASTLGFLMWNWPPASIFMGDAGSGFLGLMLAALSLRAGWISAPLFWGWLILMGAFIVDATITLTRRAVTGIRFYEPHRTHAYQHAARRFASHRPVTVAVGAINILWLLPLAVLVVRGVLGGLAAVAVAYTPLVVVTVVLGAGASETRSPGNG